MTNEELMFASESDQHFYLKCVEGLPTLSGLSGNGMGSDDMPLPYGLGPHSVKCLREIVEIVQPKTILEIGLNMAWSASLWLNLSKAYLYSIDINDKQETLEAGKILQSKYPERFSFAIMDSTILPDDKFVKLFNWDLIFIDGGHLLSQVIIDIGVALALKIPYLAFDDILPEFGQVQKAIDEYGDALELIKEMGNIALYKNKRL